MKVTFQAQSQINLLLNKIMFDYVRNLFTPTTRPSATEGVELPKVDKTAPKQVTTDKNHRSIGQQTYDFVTYFPSKIWNSIPPGLIKGDKQRAAQYKENLQKHKNTFNELGLSEEFNNLDKAYENMSTATFWRYHEGNYWGNISTAKKKLKEKLDVIYEYCSSRYGGVTISADGKSTMTFSDRNARSVEELEKIVPQAVINMSKNQLNNLLTSLSAFRGNYYQ